MKDKIELDDQKSLGLTYPYPAGVSVAKQSPVTPEVLKLIRDKDPIIQKLINDKAKTISSYVFKIKNTNLFIDTFFSGYMNQNQETFQDICEELVRELYTFGTCAVEKIKNIIGLISPTDNYSDNKFPLISGLTVIPGETIRLVPDGRGLLAKPPDHCLEQQVGGKIIKFNQDEIVLFRLINKAGNIYGFSPLEALLLEILLAFNIISHNFKRVKYSPTADEIFGVPQGHPAMDRMRAELQRFYTGGIPPAIVEDLFGLSTTRFTPQKAASSKNNNYLHLMKLDRNVGFSYKEIISRIDCLKCMMFDVSPSSLGIEYYADLKSTAAKLQQKYGLSSSIKPLVKSIAQRFSLSLLQHPLGFNSKDSWMEISTPLAVDREDMIMHRGYVESGMLSRDEVRFNELAIPEIGDEFMQSHTTTTPKGLEAAGAGFSGNEASVN